jgi:hypothetical protein
MIYELFWFVWKNVSRFMSFRPTNGSLSVINWPRKESMPHCYRHIGFLLWIRHDDFPRNAENSHAALEPLPRPITVEAFIAQ